MNYKSVMQPALPGCEDLIAESDQQKYDDFVDKFKPKKTTDDCYTPDNIMEVVNEWVSAEYGIKRADFVRPFWPGGNYETFHYPEGSVVVDNPPFSLISQILRFYQRIGQPFFLFGPALTIMSTRRIEGLCYICTGSNITYANGADVCTSFVTNLDQCLIRTAPDLHALIQRANRANLDTVKKQLPKYAYPDHVITAAIAQRWSHYGVEYNLRPQDAAWINALDAQRAEGKTIFGAGYLLSERAAAERAAAERAAAIVWPLSDRERRVIAQLSGQSAQPQPPTAGEQITMDEIGGTNTDVG